MGRDGLIWDWLNQVHPRSRVPHRAIAATAGLTGAVILLNRIEVLAEVAGFLHLILYGLISVACIVLRGARMPAYRPAYRVPLFPALPVLGAASSLAVAFAMGRLSIALGLAAMGLALLQYYLWGRRRTELRGAWPYFLRRGLLERALQQVERWGALPDEVPTMMVAVGNPAAERARLQIAAAMMAAPRGRILAVNVFAVASPSQVSDEVLSSYYQTIQARNDALREAAAVIQSSGAQVASHVPVANSVFYGLMSSAEASHAAIALLGWPHRTPEGADRMPLLAALDRYLRAHMLVLRQEGPIPAGSILAIIRPGMHGDLALLTAVQLTNAWRAHLTVAAVVSPDADEQAIADTEQELDSRVGDLARADVRAIPAQSVGAAAAEAEFHDLAIIGASVGPDGDLASLINEVAGVQHASVMVVRAHEDHPPDLWM